MAKLDVKPGLSMPKSEMKPGLVTEISKSLGGEPSPASLGLMPASVEIVIC